MRYVLSLWTTHEFQLNSPKDEGYPVCMRCQRWGFECKGPKGTTFIEGKILQSRRTVERATLPPKSGGRSTDFADYQIPLSVPQGNIDFNVYLCYARTYLRSGAPIELASREVQLISTIPAGTDLVNGRIFHHAVLSFATILFGSRHRQAYITSKGYAMLGMALKQLNQALSDSTCYTCDEVILSVATLATLESLVPTGPNTYLKHIMGLQRLLELRDPSFYCSPKSLELYKAIRHMILFASLRTGRISILARADWKTLLRANCSAGEMQEQDLFDVLAECTVLGSKRDDMLTNTQSNAGRNASQRDEIRGRALNLLNHLRVWRKRWESDERNSYSETSAGPAEPMHELREDGLSPFTTVFEFSNVSAAVMSMFYNTTLIIVLRIIASLSLESLGIHTDRDFTTQDILQDPDHLDDSWNQTSDDHIAAERIAALDVCRCIPYYSKGRSLSDSCPSPIVHWAVATALTTLRSNQSLEGRWMMDWLDKKNPNAFAKGLW